LETRRLTGSFVGIPYSSLTIGVPRETFPNERRVAMTPQNAALLLKKGFSKVLVEKDAGADAQFLNEDYEKAGATLASREEVFDADIMLKVRPPAYGKEVDHIKKNGTIISFLYPTQNKETIEALSRRNVNALAMDMIPRISRAQTFDALRFVILSSDNVFPELCRGFDSRCLRGYVSEQFYGEHCRLQGRPGGG
jgi:H+-translocating NAD(P) transhydrogenase